MRTRVASFTLASVLVAGSTLIGTAGAGNASTAHKTSHKKGSHSSGAPATGPTTGTNASGGAPPAGFSACAAANTSAFVVPNPGGGYQTAVLRIDFSDPNNPQPVPSDAATIAAASVKGGVRISWTVAAGVSQDGGTVETSDNSGYVGRFLNTTGRSFTASQKGGMRLDFALVCFSDPHFPAPPAGAGGPAGPGPMSAMFRRGR